MKAPDGTMIMILFQDYKHLLKPPMLQLCPAVFRQRKPKESAATLALHTLILGDGFLRIGARSALGCGERLHAGHCVCRNPAARSSTSVIVLPARSVVVGAGRDRIGALAGAPDGVEPAVLAVVALVRVAAEEVPLRLHQVGRQLLPPVLVEVPQRRAHSRCRDARRDGLQ